MWVWGRAQWGSPKLGHPSLCKKPPKSSLDPRFCALAQSSSLVRFYLDCLILEFGEMEVAALPFLSGQ